MGYEFLTTGRQVSTLQYENDHSYSLILMDKRRNESCPLIQPKFVPALVLGGKSTLAITNQDVYCSIFTIIYGTACSYNC